MKAHREEMLELVEGLIADVRDGTVSNPTFRRRTTPREIWFELSFCICSSQDRTKRALNAATVLSSSFDELAAARSPHAAIADLLADNFVLLRFMNRKTEHLAKSWEAFRSHEQVLTSVDRHFDSPPAARSFMIEHFAGVGPKQASMFLRNIGWGADLAIIDSHILKMAPLLLEGFDVSSLAYERLESELRDFAAEREISLQTLDVILWNCSRMAKRVSEGAILV